MTYDFLFNKPTACSYSSLGCSNKNFLGILQYVTFYRPDNLLVTQIKASKH